MRKFLSTIMAVAAVTFAGMAGASGGTTQETPDAATTPRARIPFAILYHPGPAWRAGVPMEKQGLRDHFFYLRALDKDGRIVIAGPVGPDGGLILLLARDQADADHVVAADPAVVAGLFVGKAKRFIPRFVGKAPLSPVMP